jgi:hypothetical protein
MFRETTMRLIAALLPFIMFTAAASAEEWTEIPSADTAIAVQYIKQSVEIVSPSVKKARTRFIASNGQSLPIANVYSVVSETQYNCRQPLEKVLSAKIVAADGTVTSQQELDAPVFSEIPHGTNSFRLWSEICSTQSK